MKSFGENFPSFSSLSLSFTAHHDGSPPEEGSNPGKDDGEVALQCKKVLRGEPLEVGKDDRIRVQRPRRVVQLHEVGDGTGREGGPNHLPQDIAGSRSPGKRRESVYY